MIKNTIVRRKKSQKLTQAEMRGLRAFVKGFDTKIDAAAAIGIQPNTLTDLLTKRSGRTETINKVNAAITAKTLNQ